MTDDTSPTGGASAADHASIREARPADELTLRHLQSFLPDSSPELLDYGLTAGMLFVSTDESGTPVGYLLAVPGEETHIAELVVAPGHRREGRASELLESLLDRLPAGRRVTLAVSPDNEAALSLYRDHGFERVEKRDVFFDGEPALVLAREV